MPCILDALSVGVLPDVLVDVALAADTAGVSAFCPSLVQATANVSTRTTAVRDGRTTEM
jgi:hypothetical protein